MSDNLKRFTDRKIKRAWKEIVDLRGRIAVLNDILAEYEYRLDDAKAEHLGLMARRHRAGGQNINSDGTYYDTSIDESEPQP